MTCWRVRSNTGTTPALESTWMPCNVKLARGTTEVFFWNRNAGSKLMLAFRRDQPAVAAIVAFGIAACVASYCSRRV